MITDNRPADSGNLILSPSECAELLKKFPDAEKFIRVFAIYPRFCRSPNNFCHGGKNIILALRNQFIRERADTLNLLK